MNVTGGVKYLFTQSLQSKELLGMVQFGINLAKEFEVSSAKALLPIAELIKGLGGFHILKKTLEDLDGARISLKKYSVEKNPESSFISVLKATSKCAIDIFGLLKWLGTVGGVAMLASRSNFFGSAKSLLVLPLTCHAILLDMKEFKEKKCIAIAGFVSSICLIWADALATFNPWKAVRPIPPWTIHVALLTSGAMGLIKNMVKHYEGQKSTI